jgi:hypothetical protein
MLILAGAPSALYLLFYFTCFTGTKVQNLTQYVLLEEYVDISGAPSARVLGVLARHCRDPSQVDAARAR